MAATLSQEDHEKIIALHAKGKTAAQIAEKVGCGEVAVRSAIARHELESLRSRVGPQLTQEQIDGLEIHEFACDYPEMAEADMDALVADMRESGYRGAAQRIVVWQGLILEGRHRWIAAKTAGISLGPEHFYVFEGTEQEAHDLAHALNEKRRHENVGQRSLVAARHKQWLEARGVKGAREVAAREMNVSSGNVGLAERLQRDAPEAADRVRKGEVSLHRAATEAGVPSGPGSGAKPKSAKLPEAVVERRTVEEPTRVADVEAEYEERRAMRDADSDEAWAEGLAAYKATPEAKRKDLVRDAIFLREGRPALKALVEKHRKANRKSPPAMYAFERLLKTILRPEDWRPCDPDEGGCAGGGRMEFGGKDTGECNVCRGWGYLVREPE